MREKPRKRKAFRGLTETNTEVSVPEQRFHSVIEAVSEGIFLTYINQTIFFLENRLDIS